MLPSVSMTSWDVGFMYKAFFVFHCAAGGDELEELQPWRRLPVRPGKDHCAVERAEEQQTGKAQSEGTIGLRVTDLMIQIK